MSQEEHYRRLERMYAAAPINEYYRPSLAIAEGTTELVIPVDPKFHHAAGAVHGSVYFKALDDAAYFAVNSLVTDVLVLTASFTTHLLRPITAGTLRATGHVTRAGGNLFFAESVLMDGEGREIARGSGVFAKSRIPLSEELGYL